MTTSPTPTPQPKPTVYCVQDNRLLVRTEHELYNGWAVAQNVSLVKEPLFRWKKAVFSYDMWAQCVSFLRWSQKTHKEEAMMTFFYNPKEDRWAVDVFPQRPMGMTVKLLEEHPDYKAVRMQYGSDWVQAGSIHHHCTMKAFQSGTDHEDEKDRDGVHITLGNMDQPIVDIHIRVVFDEVTYSSNLLHWIEMPNDIIVPKHVWKLDDKLTSALFLGIEDHPFPEIWKTRIIKHQPQQTLLTGVDTDWRNNGYGHGDCGYGYGWNAGADNDSVKKNGSVAITTEKSTSTESRTTTPASTASPLDGKAFSVLTEIASRLGLTFEEIRDMLIATDEDLQMLAEGPDGDEEIVMRNTVLDEIKKNGFAPLYIEALLDRVL